MRLSGWGRFPIVEAKIYRPRNFEQLRQLILAEPNLIARGNGRAYGDSAVNRSATIEMRHFNRMSAFDFHSGQLIAEAGIVLGDVINTFLPYGWFPVVTPGTKFVTLGGAIAADVHGKNHHKDGSFRTCVDWVEILGKDGEIHHCSSVEDSELFDYTLGGMGLTGIILRAAIRLRPVESAWIRRRTVAAPDLKAAMAAFDSAQSSTYSVAWIDCLAGGNALGRSLVMTGEHATLSDLPAEYRAMPFMINRKLPFTIPFDFPSLTLNRLSLRIFNELYFWAGSREKSERLVDWESYFYPLDSILDWNRIYGRKGFTQFQCVFPLDSSEEGIRSLLKETSKSGVGSFLAVLKRLGEEDGAFSFPREGYTLALDFPLTARTLKLLDRLDQIAIEHGGRFYLAKDSRMSATTLRESDPRVFEFLSFRDRERLTHSFRSVQSERLTL